MLGGFWVSNGEREYQKRYNKNIYRRYFTVLVFTFKAVQQRYALTNALALVQITRRSQVGRYARSFGRFKQIRTDVVIPVHD